MSSFSSKIELAYAFRLISKNLYDSLNALRKVRNDAAHSSVQFSLRKLREKMNNVYEFVPSLPFVIRNQAMEMMMKYKLDVINDKLEEISIPIDLRKEKLTKLFEDEKITDALEEQLPHWELIFGMCFLCGILAHERENILAVIKDNSTWGNLSGKIIE